MKTDNAVHFTLVSEEQNSRRLAVITWQCPACNYDNTTQGNTAPAAAICGRCQALATNAASATRRPARA